MKNDKCIPNAILDIVDYNASRVEQDDRARTDLWLNEFLRVFPSDLSLKSIKVTHSTSLSRQVEFEANSKDVIPLFSITYVIAISFSILSCLRFDCVRNKVWVATFGVLSAGLAVLSSFGMMLYIGVPFVMTVANSPFLILGIGVDDMFILISCWQQTNVHDKVEERLADTYKEAAISITITTLTDVLAFYIGLMTPFRSVRSFCLYTSTAILFCYLYSITFFGAFLVLNGRRENSNRHWLTCKEVPEERPPGRSKGFYLCCVGGAYDRHTGSEETLPMNHFFKKYYGPFLTKSWTKVLVILLYAAYLTTSIYGCFQIQEGIDLRNLAADDSYVVKYYNDEKEYFSEYGPNIMVITVNITTAIDEMNMLNELRDTAKKCPVPLLVYHPAFIYHDQYAVIVSNTIQNIGVTTAVMLLISLLLIPNPLCSLWVTFSIASVIGAVSTILGVVVLSASKNYIFRTFFKIMFLVIFFGLFHGITFIPVFLTFFDICSSSDKITSGEHLPYDEQALGHNQTPKCKVKPPDMQTYDNHTFLTDNNQCQTQQCPGVWSLTVNTQETQSGQMCMSHNVPVFAVDNQTCEVQMYMATNNAAFTIKSHQRMNSDDQVHVTGNSNTQTLSHSDAPSLTNDSISEPDCLEHSAV
ncbi:hypothetical protein MATL_G00023680 [Megalops atlanticus]|uniref:SSD domain-containing protein n=1 Tax=Megalops atlanticus TaxID=7932 RepID=A0A9D3THU1_MEGAT|nr:hypothetical protein MATL_G00023680 [Megalops atlanticus]